MSSPLDNSPVDNCPVEKVFLAEVALSGWCRLHNTDQHSKLHYRKFQVATYIFRSERRNSEVGDPPVIGYELVPAPRCDQDLVIESVKFSAQEYPQYQPNQRFSPTSANGSVEAPRYQDGSETQDPSS